MQRAATIIVTMNGIQSNKYIATSTGWNHLQIVQEFKNGRHEIIYSGDEQRGWGWIDSKVDDLREFAEGMGWAFEVNEKF